MKVVVLTSRQNFVWHSMQEIIPFIEQSWARDDVKVLNIDDMSLAEIVPHIVPATHVVLTCFNFKICKVASVIRETLKIKVNFITYVHNMATIAFWPFRKWGNDNFFRQEDIFVTSCENDFKTLKAVFKNPRAIVLPFSFIGQQSNPGTKKNGPVTSLVYIGRISPQKNLHNLLLAYAYAKSGFSGKLPPLVFFGKEDDLGSPNMNLKQKNYQHYLNLLVKKLGLEEDTTFRGHTERAVINEFLTASVCLSVSASLHSDENFGMAVLQNLILNNPALISDWGGHSDFKIHFPKQVTLLPVLHSIWGPSLPAGILAPALLQSIHYEGETADLAYYQQNQFEKIQPLLKRPFSEEILEFTGLADQIAERQKQYPEPQIFKDYQDPVFQEISSCYIGNSKAQFSVNTHKTYDTVPWVGFKDGLFNIEDPHKGNFALKNSVNDNCVTLTCNGQTIDSSVETAELLLNGGYLI